MATGGAIMVARGDLGVELPYEDIPLVQESIITAALSRGMPVIVATHVLESMITNPVPTRAEVQDIANSIRQVGRNYGIIRRMRVTF